MNDAQPSKKPRQKRQMHGFTRQIRGRYTADAGQLDARSTAFKAITSYRSELVASLGGADNLSAQELTLVEMCAKDWFLLQSIDAFLLQHGAYNKRKRAAYALTIQRCQVSDSLTRKLQLLKLERRSKPLNTLSALLSAPCEPTQSSTSQEVSHGSSSK